MEAVEVKTGYASLKLLFLANLGNAVHPGSEVDTTKLEDGLVYVKDFGTESDDSKGFFEMNYGTRTTKVTAVGCKSDLLKESTK